MRKSHGIALLVAGLIIGGLLITPATAHFQDSISHLAKHMKKLFLSDDQPIVLSQPGHWGIGDGGGSANVLVGDTYTTIDPTSGTVFETSLPLVSPEMVGGTSYGLQEIEICHDNVPVGDKIDLTEINRQPDTGGVGDVVGSTGTDQTSTSGTCYTVAPTSPPAAPSGSLWLNLTYNYTDAATKFLLIFNVRTTWVPM